MTRKSKQVSGRKLTGFHVGAKVLVPWGGGPVEGIVVEDRGFLGVGGRRLWRVKFFSNLPEPFYGEFGEADILLTDSAATTTKA